MKLLFDESLSPKIRIAELPGSQDRLIILDK